MKRIIKCFTVLALCILTVQLPSIPVHASQLDGIEDDLVLDVSFEGNAQDSSIHGSHGTVVGDITYVKGVKGQAIRIQNLEHGNKDEEPAIQYVNFGEGDNLKFKDENHTISMWLNTRSHQGDGEALLSNKDFLSGANPGFTYGIYSNGTRYNFTPFGESRFDINPVASSSTLNEGWHHYVFTIDRSGQLSVYIDGVASKSIDISSRTSTIDANLPLVLGASGVFENGVVDATIDELKIYKTLIDDSDVKALYIDGVVHQAIEYGEEIYNEYELNPAVDADLLLDLNTNIGVLKALVASGDLLTNYDYNLLKIAETNQLSQDVKDSAVEAAKQMVLHLNFEDDLQDLSGFGNHGTLVNDGGGVVTYEDGIRGKSLHITSPNGNVESNAGGDATEYIDLPNSDSLNFKNQSFSIALWTKQPSAPSGDASALIANKNYYSGSNVGFAIGEFSNGLTVNATAQTGGRVDTGRHNIYDNSWHFITVVVDRSNKAMDLYIDNVLKDSKSLSAMGGNIQNDAMNWVIGASATHSNGVSDTYFDEIRFYNYAIDEAQRNILYAEYDQASEFLREYDEAKTLVQDKIDQGEVSQDKVDEIQKGFAYIDAAIAQANFDHTRLKRDLKNMLDYFYSTKNPIFTFNTVTDTHIDRGNGEPSNLDNYYKDLRWLNPNSKVVMNSGDFTDSARVNEYIEHYRILEDNAVAGRYDLTALGNHDVRWLCSSSNPASGSDPTVPTCPVGDVNANLWKDRYLEYNTPYMGDDWDGESLYHKIEVDGYTFIVLNTEQDLKDWAYLSPAQLQWLDDTMAQTDKDKPVFIALHQILKDTGEYGDSPTNGDLVGAQDQELKDILSKYGNAVLFTGHVHSAADRARVYRGPWGHLMDMASFSYAYTSGNDRRNQVSYQVDVYEDNIEIRVRDHVSGEWLEEYTQNFWLSDSIPTDDKDDIANDKITPTAGPSNSSSPVENLFDDDDTTIWHSDSGDRDDLWINMHIDEAMYVSGIRYLPRANVGNGTIKEFEVWVSNDNGTNYTLHDTGKFLSSRQNWERFDFTPVKATDVKIKVISNVGSGVYASGAELRLTATQMPVLKEKLAEYIQKYDSLNKDFYTAESLNIIANLIEEGNGAVSVDVLDEILTKLHDAFDGLELKSIENLKNNYSIKYGEVLSLSPSIKGNFTYDSNLIKVEKTSDAFLITALNSGSTTLKYVADNGKMLSVVLKITTDVSKLKELITNVKAMNLSVYTKESVAVLEALLSKEDEIINQATQLEIHEYMNAIKEAVDQLEVEKEIVIEIKDLTTLIDKAKAIDLSKYTKESSDYLVEAINEAQALVDEINQTKLRAGVTQEQVDAAYKKLDQAITKLELKKDEPVVKPTDSGTDSSKKKSESAKTGVDTRLMFSQVVLISALVFIVVSYKKSRKQKN